MRSPLYWIARWYSGGSKGTLFPLDANAEETPLAVGTNDYVLTAASGEASGMKWAAATGTGGSVDPAEIAGLRGWLAAMAPLLSPNFLGTPKKNGVALATTADIPAAVSLDGVTADLSALRGLDAAKAPLLSPRFIGTPTKNGVALATTADIPSASSGDSDQFILPSQIFGA